MSSQLYSNTNIIQRVELIRKYLKFNQAMFSKYLSISQGFYSDMLRGGSGISARVIIGIAINFPEINLRWLLTGEGEMLESRGEGPVDQPGIPPKLADSGQLASEPPPGPDAEQIMRLLATLTESEQGSIKTILQAIVGMVKKG